MAVCFLIVLIRDLIQNKDKIAKEDTSYPVTGVIGFVTCFLDTLGIGNFATGTALLRAFKQVDDKDLPGTLNVAFFISVMLEALTFISSVEVEPLTLGLMIGSAVLGSWLGAGVMVKLSKKKIQKTMGFALILVAIMMIAGKFDLVPVGGTAIGLTGIKLVIGVAVNFILGALMTCGVGLYAPCMALVYALGISPRVAFPIMMGSCAMLMPVASIRFIKSGAYNRKVTIMFSTLGTVGVILAATLVKSIPLGALQWVVIVVVLYTSYSLLQDSNKNNEEDNNKKDKQSEINDQIKVD